MYSREHKNLFKSFTKYEDNDSFHPLLANISQKWKLSKYRVATGETDVTKKVKGRNDSIDWTCSPVCLPRQTWRSVAKSVCRIWCS